jgi:hypothetical protein
MLRWMTLPALLILTATLAPFAQADTGFYVEKAGDGVTHDTCYWLLWDDMGGWSYSLGDCAGKPEHHGEDVAPGEGAVQLPPEVDATWFRYLGVTTVGVNGGPVTFCSTVDEDHPEEALPQERCDGGCEAKTVYVCVSTLANRYGKGVVDLYHVTPLVLADGPTALP